MLKIMNMNRHFLLMSLAVLFFGLASYGQAIDREALVSRNNVQVTEADPLGSLSVGNGEFAFTVDVTGLQSFPEYYEEGISLGTQSQWGWHSFPNKRNYRTEEVLDSFETFGNRKVPVAVQPKKGRKKRAANWLRSNPHRLHLGLVGLEMTLKNGRKAKIEDIRNIRQELNLWTGVISSYFELEGQPVKVVLYSHQSRDLIAFRVESPLVREGRLKVSFSFPYGAGCHVCPGYNWGRRSKHQSIATQAGSRQVWVERRLDATAYAVGVRWSGDGAFTRTGRHTFALEPGQSDGAFECSVWFTQEKQQGSQPDFASTQINSRENWAAFWTEGGAMDFSECTDPRAGELERRVVLSQYLAKIQCAGQYPPQETGLTMNSWYGKFHLEMHWWHGVHFALWNRTGLLEKSMGWYEKALPEARRRAQLQGYEGARWQKMTGPEARSSPSSVGEFLAWQQPHPIYFAELFYRQQPDEATLRRFQEVVFATADFMASFARYSPSDGHYHLFHPLIPAQEIFPATETDDPPFELAYWYFGLTVAQKWRERLGLPPNPKWAEVAAKLAPLPEADGLYLPAAGATEAYTDMENRSDHPIVTGAYGMLPSSPLVDTAVMGNTFREVISKWDWEGTWGWDYPMLAMCAARLGHQDAAVDALLMDVQKNTYLPNGHNYQNKRLRIYLPGNGGLLTAVAMMAAGWDGGPQGPNPGFPDNGKWKVRWEGLKRLP